MEQQTNPCINRLNDDILVRIFDFLHFDDKIRLRRTCRRWKLLLESQIDKIKALRIGCFQQGGYYITSGLVLRCDHRIRDHRKHTGTLFNRSVLSFPADMETQCFSINRYDLLHRSLRFTSKSITMLSLGRVNLSYRLLTALTNNLPNLEHLELIGCASELYRPGKAPESCKILPQADQTFSIESFNNEAIGAIHSRLSYNQHNDEQVNVQERLLRSRMVRNCELVKQSKTDNSWSNLRHILVKDCNLLNEFTLSLILSITSQTLLHLAVESNQYLTGEFLNYCGPNLKVLRVKYCPMMQLRFLEDYVKLKQLLKPSHQNTSPNTKQSSHHQLSHPQPLNSSMLRSLTKGFNHQDIYCTL